MTRIARRLGLAALLSLPALAGAACAAEPTGDSGDGGGTPPATPVVQIAPRTMTLVVGAAQQFSVTIDSAGRAISRPVTWGASGGSIDASGRFVAGASAGPARVWATAADATPDTISGTVTAAPPPAVASVGVSLASAALTVGQATTATATTRDAQNNVLSGRAVTWSSSNSGVATVNGAGTVTAVSAGSATITATSEGVTGSAGVTVTAPPPAAVATVAVSLNAATLTAGQTTQATATLRDAQNNVLSGRTVAWSSSNTAVATVSGSGLVTAVAAGSASITATSEGQNGSATLTVQAPPPAGTGPDTVFKDTFESGNLSLWQDGVDASKHRVVTTQAHGGTRSLEITVPAGGDGGWLTRFFMPGYDSVYVSFWVRYGAEWTGGSKLLSLRGSRIDNQWSGFGNAGRCPNGTDFFSGNVTTDGGLNSTAPGYLRLYSYYPAMPSTGGCWGDYGAGRGATYADANGSTPVLSPAAQWHHVEYFFKLNAVGQSNAEQYVWVDGRRAATWTGISFRTTTDLRLNSVQINISGTFPSQQRVYFDDVVVLRGRPAGLP